jgi:hypothetical protein|mmetsp:Transcript_50275/g.132475  ORF Transcript_50275/g.132475 Transcript_50275/m.132475 type:complete len:169 (-) Transcript_50275:47-553(-)
MKVSLVLISALVSVGAFCPAVTPPQTLSSLYLFGGGGGNQGGEKKGPGMMDQLAMFKKAQEMAQKKNKLDEELKLMTFYGEGSEGKVKATMKYVPVANPMDPNPDYEATVFEFDDEFYEAASTEELAAACKEALFDGIKNTNEAVSDKYQVLQADLMEAFGQAAPPKE